MGKGRRGKGNEGMDAKRAFSLPFPPPGLYLSDEIESTKERRELMSKRGRKVRGEGKGGRWNCVREGVMYGGDPGWVTPPLKLGN